MSRPERKHSQVLLVEGRDDREVVYQFCNRRGIDNRLHFDVASCDGYERLRARVEAELDTRDTVGIVIDADAMLSQRWQSVRDALVPRYGEHHVAEGPVSDGFILTSDDEWTKRCGVWVMPDNTQSGMLEDFLLALIPGGDALLGHARQAVATLPETRFIQEHRAKAEVHTWLAWQEEPGTPLGLALERRYLDANHTLAQRFHDWLVRLFLGDDTSPSGLAGG